MAEPFPHRRFPCAECPWRRDAEPGRFPAARYAALRGTSGSPGREVPPGGPVFACHKSAEGRDDACAGWLAVAGYEHLGIRLAVVSGRMEATALQPGTGWPELFGSYEEMAESNGAGPDG